MGRQLPNPEASDRRPEKVGRKSQFPKAMSACNKAVHGASESRTMINPLDPTIRFRLRERLTLLTERPAILAILLLAVRSIVYPYAGLMHDAILYGLQVANRASGGQFAGDLFFRYGSQDQYSAFSLSVAPIAAQIGLPTAFLLAYIASSALLLYAQVRVVRRILTDPLLAILSLAILAVVDQPYGGWRIFVVHEPFLTPRIAASAFVLLAIDQVWDRRWLPSAGFILAGFALHPLMALVGMGVLIGWRLSLVEWNRRAILSAIVVAATPMLIAAYALVTRPWMDHEWLDIVRRVSPQCFPSEWHPADWVHFTLAVTAVAVAWKYVDDDARRLFALTLSISIAGLAIASIAEQFPIAILIQVQPMRALWLLHLVAVPAAVLGAANCLRDPSLARRFVGILLTFWALDVRRLDMLVAPSFWLLLAVCVALIGVIHRMAYRTATRRPAARPDWTPVAIGIALAGSIASLGAAITLFRSWDFVGQFSDWLNVASFALRAVGGSLAIFVAAVVLAAIVGRSGAPSSVAIRAASIVCVVAATTWWLRTQVIRPRDADVLPHARALIADAVAGDARPTIYWPTDIRNIWFGLHCPSYLHFAQMQGILFSRATAIEAARRLRNVRPFDLDKSRREPTAVANWQRLGRVYGPLGAAPLSASDLLALGSDTGIDYVLLESPIVGVPATRSGPLWLYDCAKLRASLASATNRGAE